MNVMPTSSWIAFSSIWSALRSFASRAPRGSSSKSTAGFEDQRAGERDPLLLPAGELVRPALLVTGQTDELERATDHRPLSPFEVSLYRRPKATFFSTLRWGNSA